jgi:hypothetical protein
MFLGRFLRNLAVLCVFALNLGLVANGPDQNSSQPRLTVWVHGTTIRAVVPVKIAGFHLESKLFSFKELRPGSLAYRRALALHQGDSQVFDLDHLYLFRWNGMLNYQERQKAAQSLYIELQQKIADIKQQTGQEPLITIIAHSHGGNIILNLADLNAKSSSKLVIHNLILLACPVQNKTAHWIGHETFEKVYVFYSKADWIQRLALHNGANLADRKFDQIAGAAGKAVHISTSWKNYNLWHNDFKGLSFVTQLPHALRLINQQLNSLGWSSRQDLLLTV